MTFLNNISAKSHTCEFNARTLLGSFFESLFKGRFKGNPNRVP